MKKFIIILALCTIALTANAQLKYNANGTLTCGNVQQYGSYTTAWYGWGHYYRYTYNGNPTWMKFCIGISDPRISGHNGSIVFFDSETGQFNNIQVKNIYTNSDVNVKTNIAPLLSPMNTIMKLKPVTYNFKEGPSPYTNSGAKEIGFIAQEVEQVLPDIVITDPEGHKLINYNAIIPILTGTIQELNARISALEAQLSIKK